jgi:hypothetical protein
MKLNLKWIQQTRQYENGFELFLNRIHIGSVTWNIFLAKDDPEKDTKRWVGQTFLFRDKKCYGASDQEVEKQIEHYVTNWFVEALKDSEVTK